MIPISGDDVIIVSHGGHRACHDSLLAYVKMKKTPHLLRLVLLTGAFLETPNQQHQREHLDFVALHRLHGQLSRRNSTQTRGALPRSLPASPHVHAKNKQKSENQITDE